MFFRIRQRYLLLLTLLFLPFSLSAGKPLLYRQIGTDCGLSNNQVQYVGQLPDRRMLVVTWRCVNIYDGGRVKAFPRQEECTMPLPFHRYFYSVCLDRDERLWIKEWGFLWCLNLRTGRYERDIAGVMRDFAGDGIGEAKMLDIYFDSENRPLLLTDKGVWDSVTKRMHKLESVEEYADIAAERGKILLFDIHGGVSVIARTNSGKPRKIKCRDCPQDEEMREFRLQTDGKGRYYRMWHRQGYARVDEFDANTLRWIPLLNTKMVLYSISVPEAGHVLVGSRHGLYELSADSTFLDLGESAPLLPEVKAYRSCRYYPTFRTEDGRAFSDIVVNNVCRDNQGGTWIALGHYGLLYHHPLRHRFQSALSYEELGIPKDAAEQIRANSRPHYDPLTHSDHDSLTDRHGRQWRATHLGIFVSDGKDSLHITQHDGLPTDFVSTLIEDRHGHVWIGTNRGLCCVESLTPLRIVRYGPDDGVPYWDIRSASAIHLPDGRLAMKSDEGWIAFLPDSVERREPKIAPMLTDVTINDGEVQPDTATPYLREITLRHDQNNICLTFAYPYYAFPKSADFRWRVTEDGKSGEWKAAASYIDDNGQLQLRFLRLPSGDYTIEVKVSDGGDVCAFRLTILPPWWQTWWAYTLYLLLAIVIIGAAFNVYLNYQKRLMEWKRKEEVLLLRINHLVEQAETVAVPEQEPAEDEEESTEESAEENEFVQRVVACIESHLGEDYTVEQLARDLRMERTGLYKRLTAVINESPQMFIRSVRLHRACELLQTTDASITEIAYKVGFSSASYLVRCFKEKYGCTPKKWREDHAVKL